MSLNLMDSAQAENYQYIFHFIWICLTVYKQITLTLCVVIKESFRAKNVFKGHRSISQKSS